MSRPTLNITSNLGVKTIASKMEEIIDNNSKEILHESKSRSISKKEEGEYKIALDKSTIETLKQKHNLVEGKSKATFFWKSSYHKKLRNIGIDTGIPIEKFMGTWCEEGLERLKNNFEQEIKKFSKNE